MSEPEPYAGIVPSSGSSTRMGTDKGLLEIDGRSFLRRTVDALSGAGCEPVIVVVADGEDDLAAEAADAGAVVLLNPDPGDGPITSLRIALAALDGSVRGVAYLPVDHPLVRPETVRALLDVARAEQPSVTIPTYRGKRGHPAVFRKPIFVELLDPELQGGAKTVVHRHLDEARLVPVDDEGVITDIDTPEAFEAVLGPVDPGHGEAR